MKHIKFQENIDGDASYNATDKIKKDSLAGKIAHNDYDDDYIPSDTIKWHSNLPEEPVDHKPLDSDKVVTLKNEASSILHGESLAYEAKMNKIGSSDQKWARTLLSKGAMADRIAAATILIQDSPIHHLNTLRNLISMVKPAKKKDGLTVIETLNELFISDLLLPEAKLRHFENRALSELDKITSGNRDYRKKILKLWIFEDQLKEIYGEYIKSLNAFAHDTVDVHKEKAISSMSKLLMRNPEQEKVLLSNIINKLGDPSQKVASKVIYHLCQILYNHPNMKKVVLDEIEKMLFRPNISQKAQYYGVCFLNQFYLSKDDNKIAGDLVRVYFSFFKACIKKGDIDSRLMSAILTGVKRCQPFLDQRKMEEIQSQSDALHKLVHLARYNISLHALALLFQISPLSSQLSDRYYQALYKKLSDPETLTTTLPALMMNLVYRSIKADECRSRILAFLKRLLQLASISDAPRACAFLLLIARLARSKKISLKLVVNPFSENKEVIENELEDLKTKNINAPIFNEINNDLTETSNNSKNKPKNNNNIISNDNKLSETKHFERSKSVKEKSLLIGDKMDLLNEEDDEEVYQDVPLEEDEIDHKKKLKRIMKNKKTLTHGWNHMKNIKTEKDINVESEIISNNLATVDKEKEKQLKILLKKSKNTERVITEYNPVYRNPAYCGAEHSIFSELLRLLDHYHPTVKVFSEKILKGMFIQYNGDPLIDFSIAKFLDRFAFKNPKKDASSFDQKADDNQEVKVVKGSHPKFAVRRNYTAVGIRSLSINSAAYLNENAEYIPVDEKFLYDYLQLRKLKTEDNSEAESDADSVNSDDFEKYLDGLTSKRKVDENDSENETEYLDYMKEMMESSKKKNKQKKDKAEDEISNNNDSDDDGDDDVSSLSGSDNDDENLDNESNSEDIENDSALSDIDNDFGLDFSEDDNDRNVKDTKNKNKTKNSENESDLDFSDGEDDTFDVPKVSKLKKGKRGDIESMFASAEEFATLLEETGTDKRHGTYQSVANAENTHTKQLNWESQRDRWMKGYNKNIKSFKQKKTDNKHWKNQHKNNKNSRTNNIQVGQKRKFSGNKKIQSKRARC